jgi:hypothetical protein
MPNYTYNVYEVYADGTEVAHALNIQTTNYKFDNLADGQSYTYRIDLLKDGEKVAEESKGVQTKGIPNKVFHLYKIFTTEDAGLFYINHSQMLEGYAEVWLSDDLSATVPDTNVDRLVDDNLTLEHEYNANGGDKDDDGTLLYETRFIVDGLSPDTDYRLLARTNKTNFDQDEASNEWAVLNFKTEATNAADDSGNAPDPAKDHTIVVVDCGKRGSASENLTIKDMPIYSDANGSLNLDGTPDQPFDKIYFKKHPKTGDPNDWKTGYQTIEFDAYFDNSVEVNFKDSHGTTGGGPGSGTGDEKYNGGGPNYNSSNHDMICFIGKFKGNILPDLPRNRPMFYKVQYRASRENPIVAIENLDVSNQTVMAGWFLGKYNADSYSVHHLDKWDVSNVEDFSHFGWFFNKYGPHLPQPNNQMGYLGHWDVRKAKNVDFMFSGGSRLDPTVMGITEWCFDNGPSRYDFGNSSNKAWTPSTWNSGGTCPPPTPAP